MFISYRRADSQATTGRIHERLVAEFGPDTVFVDVDTIPAGAAFSEYYTTWLMKKAAVMLVIIGNKWAGIKAERDPNALPRLQQDGDHVRIEVATALTLDDIVVLPVLVDDAKMPEPSELPEDVRGIAAINGVVVRHDPDFRRDMDSLIKTIRGSQGS